MATLTPRSEIKYQWLQKEINLPKIISRGSKHKIVKPIQEWLCFHGFKTGVDQDFNPEVFDTIEGNTNDEGHREGYQACQRTRAYKKKDFLKLV